MSLKVLCDENIPNAIQASLRERGFDVARVRAGMSDPEVAALAKQGLRILITFDSDFANILAYPPQEYFGIVRISIKPPLMSTIIRALDILFNAMKTAKEFEGRLIILEAATFRIWDDTEEPEWLEGSKIIIA